MTGRARNILLRFPTHFEAARDGKRLGEVVEALASDTDLLNALLASVRRSHRLRDTEELADLMKIAALHGITEAELALLFTRQQVLADGLKQAADDSDAAENLIALWGVHQPAPRLVNFAPAGPADKQRSAFVEFAGRTLARKALMTGLRSRIRTICAIHAHGNGTVRALMEGAANALDLDIVSVEHDKDRYLHTAQVRDRIHLSFPVVKDGKTTEAEFEPAAERLLLEENPQTLTETGKIGRKHRELFSTLRRGFERTILRVEITGIESKTVGPMIVNRDEGHGLGYFGSVPAGESLTFSEEGRAMLGSADVTAFAFAWQGACFADSTSLRAQDFVFAGGSVSGDRVAQFAVSTPVDAIDSGFVFPHAGDSLPMPGISVGETRFAFFVQEAHTSRLIPGPPESVQRVAPRPAVGFLDQSVFSTSDASAVPISARVNLSWLERTAYWVNVWIPERFRHWTPDDEEGRDTRARVVLALNRFRPAGVQVAVEFLDDRWVLGRGMIEPADQQDTGIVAGPGSGTDLWTAPTE